MEEINIVDNYETPKDDIKELELFEGNIKYKCEIKKDNDYLNISIYNNIIKYKGQIHIYNIQNNLGILNYNINDIFDSIYILNNNKFNLIKDLNKYILEIEFIILNKRRYINIDLYDIYNNINNSENEYIKSINELKEIIKEKDNKIKLLQEELNSYKYNNKYDDTYDNFNIKDKEPKQSIKYHTAWIRCSTVLKDGRFVIGYADNTIIIYNSKTFKPDLIIKEHKDGISCIIQLSSGELVSSSYDKTVNIYNIDENEYRIIQTLSYHNNSINKIIELKNKQLVSCSSDKSIIFYSKDNNNEYIKDFSILTEGKNGPVIQTKDNEIFFYEYRDTICFYDFIKRKMIKKINNITVSGYFFDSLLMISKDLLLITGFNQISIINVNSYNLIRTIRKDNSDWINVVCMLNKDIIITGDKNRRLIQWKIENDNLKLISQKENAHNSDIFTLAKLGNGLVLSGSKDCSIIIW